MRGLGLVTLAAAFTPFMGIALAGLALAVGLGVAAWLIPKKPIRVLLVIAALACWLGSAAVFVGVLTFERDDIDPVGALDCPEPGQDSTFAPSRWSWVPPGEVCEYASGDVGPSWLRVPVALGFVGFPVVGLALWPLRRGRKPNAELAPSPS